MASSCPSWRHPGAKPFLARPPASVEASAARRSESLPSAILSTTGVSRAENLTPRVSAAHQRFLAPLVKTQLCATPQMNVRFGLTYGSRRSRFDGGLCGCYDQPAGWSSLVARWAHNPKVGGSNPPPATNSTVWFQWVEPISQTDSTTLHPIPSRFLRNCLRTDLRKTSAGALLCPAPPTSSTTHVPSVRGCGGLA